jgi:fatty-acid desaturase
LGKAGTTIIMHATSPRHGLKWYEIDMNWYGIWTLMMLGLATQIKRAWELQTGSEKKYLLTAT